MRIQTVTDIDGNVYNTVTIGSHVFMVENRKLPNTKMVLPYQMLQTVQHGEIPQHQLTAGMIMI